MFDKLLVRLIDSGIIDKMTNVSLISSIQYNTIKALKELCPNCMKLLNMIISLITKEVYNFLLVQLTYQRRLFSII